MVQSTVVGYVNASAYVCEVTGALLAPPKDGRQFLEKEAL